MGGIQVHPGHMAAMQGTTRKVKIFTQKNVFFCLRIHPRPHGSTGPPYDAPPHVPHIMQTYSMPQIMQVEAIANMVTMGQDVLRGIHSRLDLTASLWLLLFNLVE